MAFRLSQIKRLLDPVETPEAKATVQPVTTAAAKTLEAPKPVGMSFGDLLGGQFGGDGYWDAIKPMFSQLGYSDYLQAPPEFQGSGDSYDYSANVGRVKQSVLDDLAAKGYTVNKRDLPGDEIWLDLYQNGQKQGEYKAQNKSSAFETFMENGGALAIPFMAAGLFDPNGLMSALGMGSEIAPAALDAATSITPMTAAEVAAGAPALTAIEGSLGMGGLGALGLDAAAMIPGVTVADMATIAPALAGGSPGLLAGLPASIAPMTAAEVAAGAPIASSTQLAAMAPVSVSSVAPAALASAPSITPMTAAEVAAGAPVTSASVNAAASSLPASVAPAVTNSVLADSAAGTAGYGASSAGAGGAATSAASGLGGALTNVYDFLKANPTLGKLLFSGATGLLSGIGSSGSAGSSGGAEPAYGAPKQWNSAPSVQGQSLLAPVTQAPGMVMPSAIPAQGQQNAGAWRYMRGV